MKTIGEQLKQARLARGITLAEAADATAIRANYIAALEADDFEALPSPVQLRGFLRNYAAYLGLQPSGLLAQLHPAGQPTGGIQKVDEASSSGAEETVEPLGQESPPEAEIIAAAAPASQPPPGESAPTDQRTAAAEGPGEISQQGPAPEVAESLIFPTIPYLDTDENGTASTADEKTSAIEQNPALSRSIFIEIGEQLRQRRELLSLSLDEIERHTRIARHYLATLEAGRFEDMPSPVQARGTLTAYARFIDLDTELILLRFADALQAQRHERYPLPTRRRQVRSTGGWLYSLRRFLSTDLVFGGGLVVAIAIFTLWGTVRVMNIRAQKTDQVNAQSISQVLLATQAGLATPSPAATGDATTETAPLGVAPVLPSSTPTVFPTQFSTAAVQLIVVSSGRTWMRVTADGKIAFEGRTSPGDAYSFEGEKQIELLAADAGAIELIYNRENIGAPGNPGGVVDLIYTANAVLLPSPTITPSPTRTLRPSATPRPSSTPRFTPTPIRTPAPIG